MTQSGASGDLCCCQPVGGSVQCDNAVLLSLLKLPLKPIASLSSFSPFPTSAITAATPSANLIDHSIDNDGCVHNRSAVHTITLRTYPTGLQSALTRWHSLQHDVSPNVRTIIIEGTPMLHSSLDTISFETITSLLRQFPRCNGIKLVKITWVPSRAPTPVTLSPHMQQLSQLVLRNVEIMGPSTDLRAILTACSSLQDISVTDVRLAPYMPHPALDATTVSSCVANMTFASLTDTNFDCVAHLISMVALSVETVTITVDPLTDDEGTHTSFDHGFTHTPSLLFRGGA